jgi:3-mercaptopyruvate sulfurtransferase SseA/sterol desaturase/sphingolipid hydroxylase (fatty acid hydroxylase superfamily)
VIYPAALAAASLLVAGLERLWPWRREQRQLRPTLGADLLHLLFNGHFLGLILYGIAVHRVLPWVDRLLDDAGLFGGVYRDAAAAWPMWLQIIVALVVVDFAQWCVHNALHRIGPLWNLHKVHHSVKDGEMDWIVSFRFQWTEVVLYKAVLYLPLAWFGFAEEALLFHAIFGTVIGHLNHANLDIDWGWGRYILNSPRMHIWHHDYDAEPPAYNFGIIFSTWDWIFGTAHLPDHPPRKLGFEGVEEIPAGFFAQEAWQVGAWVPALQRAPAALAGVGIAVLATGWALHEPPAVRTPMMGEQAAASQPTATARVAVRSPASAADAADALGRFGDTATRDGFAHPEWMVSALEVAEALSAERLVLLDVRPDDRVEAGRIPSALPLDRGDYSVKAPAPGVSADAAALQALLRSKGVDDGDVVVLYGDGGPEPYRLWWTLRMVAGLETRVLDGGLPAWKALGQAIAGGPPLTPEPGTVTLTAQPERRALLWEDLAALQATRPGLSLIDTRSAIEFTGAEQHKKAARPGHIPGAKHLDWTAVLREPSADPRLLPPDALSPLLDPLRGADGTVTYCQSGTRSSTVYFAMVQLGWDEARIWNYDGSWAEYSRLGDLPVETGPVAQMTDAP